MRPAVADDAEVPTSTRLTGAQRAWMVLACVVAMAAVWEFVAQLVITSRVPAISDWRSAGSLVRQDFQDGDAISVAPRWADPIMRMVTASVLTARAEGRSELTGYKRLWAITIRGEEVEDAPHTAPELTRTFGGVTVRRFRLPPANVYDLNAHIQGAHAQVTVNDVPHPCTWRHLPQQRGGGLDQGPFAPQERFACDVRPWVWVGATVIEDLELRPRSCIWQHPPPDNGMSTVSFSNVPAGHFVMHGGLHWVQERWRRGGRVEISITQNGNEIAHMTHRDGDGWARIEGNVPSAGELSISVSAPEGDNERTFCWDANIETGAAR